MPHKHKVYDTDTHFSINPITRAIKNESSSKTTLMQYDHNSERFTFEIPRYIEEHDMSCCNMVQVHFVNIDAKTKAENADVYDVEDMQASPYDDDVVICSWLISRNATLYAGILGFIVRFACVSDDGTIEYAWNTSKYTGISVSDGINNGDAIEEEYSDVLSRLDARLSALEESGIGGGVSQETLTSAMITAALGYTPAKQSDIPSVPVQSVNGKTGAVQLGAADVKARPDTWTPSASDVGADTAGTATDKVAEHNVSDGAHNDIRLLIAGLTERLNAVANSDDTTLDQLSEIVAYIKSNKSLIDSITTSKVNVSDIIDNLTTSAANKPLSAKMGVQLKTLIDAIKIPTTLPASDVYDWAKKPQKPSYTADEVGALAKNQGAGNVGKILVVGTDGNLTLTDMPEGGASGDVVGVFDDNNNILLTGNIAVGTYTLMFESADGTYTGSGTLTVSEIVPEPAFTNLADPASADWQEGYRLSISSATTSELAGHTTTNYIPFTSGDVVRVKGLAISSESTYGGGPESPKLLIYTANKSRLVGAYGTIAANSNQCYGLTVTVAGDVSTITPLTFNNGTQYDISNAAYIRFDGFLMDGYTKNDVIITVNEEITE